ncbi:hypothetical protein [Nocardia salmonicida]|uniref:hypothetical protein n=1 Tax=Nocardia salmonicida TaxID=53431 RepID=UPI0033EC7D27
MIAPVIPPQSTLQELVHGPLAATRSIGPADDNLVIGTCTVGDGGRILDKITFAALDLSSGTRLELTCLDAGILLVRPAPAGATAVTEGGYFRVPYRLRRRVSLSIGARALLIGHRGRRALLIHPPTALGMLCAPSLQLLTAGA